MKEISNKVIAIIGTATLAVGLIALPAVAQTTPQQGNEWFGQMQEYMQKTFSPEQHQNLMNSSEMQNLHNSRGMQDAMQTGDIEKMQELMNADLEVKAQLGKDNLDKMNEFMSNSSGGMMTNGSGITGSQGTMMNGSGNSMASQIY